MGVDMFNGREFGFLDSNGNMSYIDAPNDQNVTLFGHVSGGRIAGGTGSGAGFVYDIANRSFTSINDPLGYRGTQAVDVSGQDVVGNYWGVGAYGDTVEHEFLYNGAQYITVDDPLGVGSTTIQAIDGNNVLGTYRAGSGSHAFLYDITKPADAAASYTTLSIPVPSNANNVWVTDISGNDVVGYYDFHNVAGGQGFIYDIGSGGFTTLDDPLGTYTAPAAISDGNIVGTYTSRGAK
ncbi:MAG TPA: hypothetical protein VMV10_04105 [Pirellulales bacterium]|nr:hypothetical protein [Pirellulales bacterium]